MLKLSDIKGIGPKTEQLLNKISINTVDDLVSHYPFRYEVLKRSDLKSASIEDKIIIDGKVESVPLVVRFRGGLNKLNFRLATVDGSVGVSIFNRAFLKPNLKIGTNLIVIGKYDSSKNIVSASEIKFGFLGKEEKIEPVYNSTSGLNQKSIAKFINAALVKHGNDLVDNIPRYLLDKYNFSNKKTALNIVHNPPTFEKLEEAEKRLKYEELFEFMFKINTLKIENSKNEEGILRTEDTDSIDKVVKTLDFELTGDQKMVLEEIIEDLKSTKRMNRILQGDVGSGKTIVAFLAMYYNCLSGYQSALMVPTEILATQHYNNMRETFKKTDLNIVLLTGSTPKKEKKEIYEELANNKIDVVIGTHALIQDEVVYANLGLVVTDEQHRFGVNQRANLKNKGFKPDVLYMSATPIPRTYALTIYGDMDISIIKEMPKGRKPVTTFVKNDKQMKEVLQLMYEELQANHQIYVIAPLIEESENTDLTTVYELRDKLNLAFGKKYKLDLVHGKMKSAAKELVMSEFKQGSLNILISTTVIEVGVDVPNATMMVIFNAERFGLSTLHQLRGRVGRGDAQAKCILVSEYDRKRLEIMETEHDGFVISEEDFKLRGAGDLFGTKQSGDMIFKIANLRSDYRILAQANKDALEYIKNDEYKDDEIRRRLTESINSN